MELEVETVGEMVDIMEMGTVSLEAEVLQGVADLQGMEERQEVMVGARLGKRPRRNGSRVAIPEDQTTPGIPMEFRKSIPSGEDLRK